MEKLLRGTGAAALQTSVGARIDEHREVGSRPTAGAAAGLGDAEQQELLSKPVNGSTTLDLQCLISTLRDLT